MATANTTKVAADQAAAFTKETVKTAVETSVAAFDELNAQSKRTIEALTESVNAATSGAQTLSNMALTYSRSAFEGNMAVAKRLSGVKTIQEALDIQTAHAKSSVEGYFAELNRWTDALTSSALSAAKPINERVAAAVEQLQKAH